MLTLEQLKTARLDALRAGAKRLAEEIAGEIDKRDCAGSKLGNEGEKP